MQIQAPVHAYSSALEEGRAGTGAAAHSNDDPWAGLQQAYRIVPDDRPDGSVDSPREHQSSSKHQAGDGQGDIVFEGTAGRGSGKTTKPGVRRPQAAVLPVTHISAVPRQGDWGSGTLAKAGTLMVHDEHASATGAAAATLSTKTTTQEAALDEKLQRKLQAVTQQQSELGIEDLEDIEDFVAQPAGQALSAGLASKLAAFEALADGVD